jgi:hypothetical protein
MDQLAADLYSSLRARADDLRKQLLDLSGRLAASRHGLRQAVRILEMYPDALLADAKEDFVKTTDAADRVVQLRFYLKHVTQTASFVEEFFSRGTGDAIPATLVAAAERECRLLLGEDRYPVLAVGSADNFETLISELVDVIFHTLDIPKFPDDLRDARFAVMRIPRIEAGQALWRPLILGHELAHLAIEPKDVLTKFDLEARVDRDEANQLSVPDHVVPTLSPNVLNVRSAGEEWLEELVCDAYALRRFGPAAVSSLCSFFELVGAWDEVGDHPPGWFRTKMLVRWMGSDTSSPLEPVLAPWRELADAPPPAMPDWAEFLVKLFDEAAADVFALVNDWAEPYNAGNRANAIEWITSRYMDGIPPAEFLDVKPEDESDMCDADAINAGWLARAKGTRMPVAALVDKSLESLDFLGWWNVAKEASEGDA